MADGDGSVGGSWGRGRVGEEGGFDFREGEGEGGELSGGGDGSGRFDDDGWITRVDV